MFPGEALQLGSSCLCSSGSAGLGTLGSPSSQTWGSLILCHGKTQHRKLVRNVWWWWNALLQERFSSILLGLKAVRTTGTPAAPGRVSRATRAAWPEFSHPLMIHTSSLSPLLDQGSAVPSTLLSRSLCRWWGSIRSKDCR